MSVSKHGMVAPPDSRMPSAGADGSDASRRFRRQVSEAGAGRAWGRLAALFLSEEARPALRQAAMTLDDLPAAAQQEAAPSDGGQDAAIAEAVIGALGDSEGQEAFDSLTVEEQAVVLTLLWEEISDAQRTRGFVSLAFWDLLATSSAAAGGGRGQDVTNAERHGADVYGTDAPRIVIAGGARQVAPVMSDGGQRGPAVMRQAQILRELAAALPVADLSRALMAQAARLAG